MSFQDELAGSLRTKESLAEEALAKKQAALEKEKEELRNHIPEDVDQVKAQLLEEAKAGHYHTENGKKIISTKIPLPSSLWTAKVTRTPFRYRRNFWGQEKFVGGGEELHCYTPFDKEELCQFYLNELNTVLSRDGITQEKIVSSYHSSEHPFPHRTAIHGWESDWSVYIYFRAAI